MGNIPVIHETTTSLQSLGHAENTNQPMYENSPFANYQHTPDFTPPTFSQHATSRALHTNATSVANSTGNLSVAGRKLTHYIGRTNAVNPNHAKNLLKNNLAMNIFAEGRLTALLEARESTYIIRHHARYGNIIELKNTGMKIGFRWDEYGDPIEWIDV
eukprot:gene21662-22588_t